MDFRLPIAGGHDIRGGRAARAVAARVVAARAGAALVLSGVLSAWR